MEALPALPEWVSLEHQVAEILTQQELHGWRFNEHAAWQLTSTLTQELREIEETLRRRHPYVGGAEFTPRRNNRTQGYEKGAPFTRLKDLNCTSRDHIAWILTTHYGWTPTQMTTTGKPVVDEVILTEIGSEISMKFARCLTVTKMLGMLSNGTNAWLKLSTNDRIHHHCSVNASTHRCAHRNPNLAQVPSDERFRQLFIASKGMVLCGADLSGIELKMLSHYLARWDAGRYADILLNGDIHQVNADKIGVTRSQIKKISYAFLYGAGDEKIGHSYDKQLSSAKARKKGREIRAAYVDAIDGLGDLLDAVKKAAVERGFIKSIDGRKIALDSPHKALNFLLQSGAGVVAKRWMVINQEQIKHLLIDCHQLAFVHDELQFEVHPNHAQDLCSSLVLAATEAGEYYKLRCRIDAEATIGDNWSETH